MCQKNNFQIFLVIAVEMAVLSVFSKKWNLGPLGGNWWKTSWMLLIFCTDQIPLVIRSTNYSSKCLEIEPSLLQSIGKSMSHYFEQHDLWVTKEIGSENWCRSRLTSLIQDLLVRSCKRNCKFVCCTSFFHYIIL